MGDLLRLAKELGLPLRRDQRPALHARRTTRPRTRSCSACSRARPSTTRTASSSTRTSSTSRRRRRCASCSATTRRRATTRCSSPSAARSTFEQARPHAALPGARGRDRGELVREGGRARAARRASRRRPATKHLAQAKYEVEVITQMGFPGYFLVVADFIALGEGAGHPGRPGPRLGRRLDGVLRDGHHRARPAARTGSSSSASSTPSASRCPTSTSTSTTVAAPRSSATSPRSTATTASPRSSPTARSRPSRR